MIKIRALGSPLALMTAQALHLPPTGLSVPYLCPFGSLHTVVLASLDGFHCRLAPTADEVPLSWPFVRQLLATQVLLSQVVCSNFLVGKMASCGQKLPCEEPGQAYLVSSERKKVVKDDRSLGVEDSEGS